MCIWRDSKREKERWLYIHCNFKWKKKWETPQCNIPILHSNCAKFHHFFFTKFLKSICFMMKYTFLSQFRSYQLLYFLHHGLLHARYDKHVSGQGKIIKTVKPTLLLLSLPLSAQLVSTSTLLTVDVFRLMAS